MDVSKLAPYAKTAASVIGWFATLVALYISLTSDGNLSADDAGALVAAVLGGIGTTVGIFQIKNQKVTK